MDMYELFRDQLKYNGIIGKEELEDLEVKHYHSGEPIQEGDQVLFSFLDKGYVMSDNGELEKQLEIIRFKADEMDRYEPAEGMYTLHYPVIKEKE